MRRVTRAAALIGGIVFLWRARLFRVEVKGRSMEPVLRPGDFLVATAKEDVHRGALVVVAHPERPFEMVKRVSAVPGDEVEGRPLGGGQYWLIGDNPSQSTDSRSLGPVTSGDIKGVVLFRYWPLRRIAWLR